jgi:hypothetical protein
VNIAKSDSKANVRASAIDYLSVNFEDEDLQAIYKNGLNDKSYNVLGSALVAIAKANPKEGLLLAKQYENEKNTDVLSSIAELYANNGTAANNDFYVQSEDKFKGYSKITFIRQYYAFLKNVDNDEMSYFGAQLFKSIADKDNSNKWVVGYAKKGIKDLATLYEDKAKSYSQMLKVGKLSTEEIQNLEKKKTDAQNKQQKIMEVHSSIR